MKIDRKKNILQRIRKSMQKLKRCNRLRVDIFENEYRSLKPPEHSFHSPHLIPDGDNLVGELFDKSTFGWYISEFRVDELYGYGIISMIVKRDMGFGVTNISSDFIELMKKTMDSFNN